MNLALKVVTFVLIDLFVIWTILSYVFRKLWTAFAKDFPPRDVTEPSATKTFQTFRINTMNLGNCVHVTLDDHCLHLNPAKMLRWMGLGRVSIPWETIQRSETKAKNRMRGTSPTYREVKIGDSKVTGPAWCFQLVFGEETDGSDEKSPVSQQ
jgi:hypothetical protein